MKSFVFGFFFYLAFLPNIDCFGFFYPQPTDKIDKIKQQQHSCHSTTGQKTFRFQSFNVDNFSIYTEPESSSSPPIFEKKNKEEQKSFLFVAQNSYQILFDKQGGNEVFFIYRQEPADKQFHHCSDDFFYKFPGKSHENLLPEIFHPLGDNKPYDTPKIPCLELPLPGANKGQTTPEVSED